MGVSPDLQKWSARYEREGYGCGAVFNLIVRWGTHPAAATELMTEARQEAVTRILYAYARAPRHFRDYRHFANSVTQAAANWLRDQRRRNRGVVGIFDNEFAALETDPREQVVRQAFERLVPTDQEIIGFGVLQGWTLDELADKFLPRDEASANARRLRVRRQLVAALTRLRIQYEELDR